MKMASASMADKLPSLLLLPFPPSPSGRDLLSAAYRPSITATLAKLRKSESGCANLIVAVACPLLHGQFARSKTLSWSEAQSLLAGIYSLISVVCAELGISTELDGESGSVDASIILIDHDRKRSFPINTPPGIETNSTVVVDLASFASAYHPWKYIFHVSNELGLELFNTYLKLAEGKQTLMLEQFISVEGGLTFNVLHPQDPSAATPQISGYPVVCLGGTFDYLHPGHKLLLTAGALLLQVPQKELSQTCKFIIGITGDELLKNKKYAAYVQPWETRARNVIIFLSRLLRLSTRGWKDELLPTIEEQDGDFRASFRDGIICIQCVRIQDAFGPTITLENMDALVVSSETRSGGRAVNDKRAELGWRALDVYEVDVLDAKDISNETEKLDNFTSKISSTEIRQKRAEATEASKT